MPDTALHRVLNVRNRDLTANDLHAAVDLQICESDELDWKKVLPAKSPNAEQAAKQKDFAPDREFAKDVAAMANSGGGTIVFGIEEDGVTSAAKSIFGAGDWGDSVERKLRSWASSNIQPPIYELFIRPVPVDNKTVVIVHIPASSQAPHFVSYTAETHRVPRRTGTRTVYMAEREIEAAYRSRFRSEADLEKTLQKELYRALARVRGPQVDIAMIARPSNTRPSYLGPISPEEMESIHLLMLKHCRFLQAGQVRTPISTLSGKRGFRRWTWEKPAPQNTIRTLFSVFDDGSLLVGLQSRLFAGMNEGSDLHAKSLFPSPAYLGQFVEAAAKVLRLDGDFHVRTVFVGKEPQVWIRDSDEDGVLTDKQELLPIVGMDPVDAVFTASDDGALLMRQLRDHVLDLVNLGGVNYLRNDILVTFGESGR